jgi:hypothetical protein
MIISASYKTDIPAFYGQWFINRLNAGYCSMVNPYNRKVIRVSLTRQDADGFVFWTKNISPFLKHLPQVKNLGYPFVVQHTINGYPRELEFSVVDADRSVENLHRVARDYGQDVPVWRYDTIVFTSLTPFDFHVDNFEQLARKLRGATTEVVISFAHFYRKTLRNMTRAAGEFDFSWDDSPAEKKRELAAALVRIANDNGMVLSVCSQRDYLVDGAADARCVDARRLEKIAGNSFSSPIRGNRKQCGCFQSRDIGEYDTCPHGCVYCYAVQNRELAQRRFKLHDAEGEFLFAPQFPTTAPTPLAQLGRDAAR